MTTLAARSSLLLVPTLALVGFLAKEASAQGRRLNGALARPLGGDVVSHALSANGERVVYVADQDTDGFFELFSAKPSVAGARVKLASPAPDSRYRFIFSIGPRGRHVAFTGSLSDPERSDLHCVPIDGGPIVELARANPLTHFSSLQFDPAETHVFYQARAGSGALEQGLYRVPIGGGESLRLDQAGGRTGVRRYLLAPDGTRAVYVSDQDAPEVEELFSVAGDGGPALQLNPEGSKVLPDSVLVDPRGAHVVFVATLVGVSPVVPQLYSAPLDGGRPAVELLPRGPARAIQISPDGTRVLCMTGDARWPEVLTVPIDGSPGRVVLHQSPVGVFSTLLSAEFTPDSRSVLFEVGTGGAARLLRGTSNGSAPTVELATSTGSGFTVSSDSTLAVFLGLDGPDLALFTTRVDGSLAPVRIADGTPRWSIDPASGRVVYLAPASPALATYDLESVPILGGVPPARLNEPLPYGGTVGDSRPAAILLSPVAGGRAIYLASQVERDRFELFSAPVDGGAPPFRINTEMPTGTVEGDVLSMDVSPDGVHAVYRADQDTNGVFELYAARTDRSEPSVKLSGPLAPGESVGSFAITPDGTRVAYWVEAYLGPERLLVVPIEGGPSLALTGPLQSSGLWIDPASTHAVFLESVLDPSDGSTDRRALSVPLDGSLAPFEIVASGFGKVLEITPGGRLLHSSSAGLFSVPIDGSAAGVQLDAPQVAGGAVGVARLDASGTRVVYLGDLLVDGRNELFSVPVDGSAAPVRLTPSIANDRDASAPVLTSDGFAVFSGDLDVDGSLALYRVPIDGSAAPLRLNAPLASWAGITNLLVSPDGTRVVYVADARVDGRLELFSVPSHGGGPVRRLSGLLGQGDVGGTSSFSDEAVEIDPSGTHVVYRASRGRGLERKLFRVPIDGGAAPALLSAPAPYADGVTGFRIAPGGESIVYRALLSNRGFGLFQVPADGSARARSISGVGRGPDRGIGHQPAFEISPDGGRVVFHSDQATSEVFELFLSTLPRPFRAETLR